MSVHSYNNIDANFVPMVSTPEAREEGGKMRDPANEVALGQKKVKNDLLFKVA